MPGRSGCPELVLREVEELVVLGACLAADGNLLCPVGHRTACCNAALGRHRRVLCFKDAPIKERLAAHMATLEAALLHGAESWTLCKSLGLEVAAAGRQRLRTTCRLWKRRLLESGQIEARRVQLERTAAALRRWCKQARVLPVHVRLLQLAHRAACRAVNLSWGVRRRPWRSSCGTAIAGGNGPSRRRCWLPLGERHWSGTSSSALRASRQDGRTSSWPGLAWTGRT